MLASIRNCAGVGALAIASLSGHALAQGTPNATTDSNTSENASHEEIIVTARLRSERLQDVPVAATAFSSAELQRYNTDSLPQLSTRTPGLNIGITGAAAGAVIALRGVGAGTNGSALDQAVSINIDGAQVSQANVLRLGLYDVERVEVLKGPQTLFFGKNSPGGVISIASANPGDKLEAKLRTGYEFEAKNKFVEAMISSPLTETLGLRLAGFFSDEEGYFRSNPTIGRYTIPAAFGGGTTDPVYRGAPTGPRGQTYFVRGTLAYQSLDGAFDANLKVAYARHNFDTSPQYSQQLISCNGAAPQWSLAVGQNYTDCKLDRNVPAFYAVAGGGAGGTIFSTDQEPRDDLKQFLSTLTLNYRPSDKIVLTSVSSLYNSHLEATSQGDYNALPFNYLEWIQRQRQYTQELRLLTKTESPFNFMLGGYYQHMDNESRDLISVQGPFAFFASGGKTSNSFFLVNSLFNLKTDAYSAYGQVIVDINDRLQLTAGGRYSTERKLVTAISYPNGYTSDTFDFVFNPNKRKFHNFSPDVTLTYKALPTLTLYGAYRKGFLSGGIDIAPSVVGLGKRSSGDLSYGQELVEGGEIGAKGSIADRQITFDLVVYDYRYKGLQLSALDSEGLTFRTVNAGSALVRGGELGLQVRPNQIRGLTLRTNVAYNPAKYGTFRNAPCYTGQTQTGGCNVIASRGPDGKLLLTPALPTQTANVQDLSGKALVRNSDWTGSIGASYEGLVTDGVKLSVSGDALYTGSYFSALTLEPSSFQHEAWRFNARIAVGAENDRWELALVGTNLTNVLRASLSSNAVFTGRGTGTPNGVLGDEVGSPTPPRTVTLQATFRY